MSKFIHSFTESIKTKPSMKLHFYFRTEQWAIHILPTIDFYIETKQPFSYDTSWKNGLSGIYLCIAWLKWTATIGTYKRLK
jgi:hypothetical protein